MELFIFARFHARTGQEKGVETALRIDARVKEGADEAH
jgi:hypothetical protein